MADNQSTFLFDDDDEPEPAGGIAIDPVSGLKSGVYQIRCTTTGKVYVGSAVNIGARWSTHRSDLRNNKHHCSRLQNAWNKYGSDAFVCEVLEYVGVLDQLRVVEQEHLDERQAADRRFGFNSAARVEGHRLGIPMPAHVRAAISAANRRRVVSSEQRRLLSERNRGRKHPPEVRARISAAHKGRTFSPEHCENISRGKKGRKASVEERARMSASRQGRKHTPETKKKLSDQRKGQPCPEARRAAVAEANRKRVWSDEAKAKASEALKSRLADPEFQSKIREGRARPEARQRASESRRGRVHTAETRAKMSASQKGRTFTPESIERMRETHRNLPPFSEEHRRKLSESHTGLVQSAETRAKKSAALKGRPLSEEARQHLRDAWVRRKANRMGPAADA